MLLIKLYYRISLGRRMNPRHLVIQLLILFALILEGTALHAQKVKDLIAKTYYDKAQKTESVDSALKYLKQSEARLREVGDLFDLPLIYDMQSTCLIEQGKTIEALKTSLVGLQLAERYKDPYCMALSNLQLSALHIMHFDDLNDSKKYFEKVGKNLTRLDTDNQAFYYNVAGLIAAAENDHQEAIRLLQKARRLSETAKDSLSVSNADFNMALSYLSLKDSARAIEAINRSVAYSQAQDNNLYLAQDYAMLANVMIESGAPKPEILNNIQLAERYELKAGSTANLSLIYELYSKYYEQVGSSKMSLKYLTLADEQKERNRAIQRIRETRYLEAKFSDDVKLKNIEQLKQERASKEQLLQAERKTNLMASVGMGILLILLGASGIAYRSSRKFSKYIHEEDRRKELLLQEVHHRINNSLQITTSLLAMQANSTNGEEARDVLKKSESRIHAMAKLHSLLDKNARDGALPIDDYLNGILDFHRNMIDDYGSIEIETRFPAEKLDNKKALPVALVINELVTNSLKYAFPEGVPGKIEISLSRVNQWWSLYYSDNGVGMGNSKVRKNYSSNMGMGVVRILCSQLGGELQELSVKRGCAFRVVFSGTEGIA